MQQDNLPPLKDVIAKYDLRAKKNLGQNFLLDLNLTAKIAKSAGDLTNYNIIEIGPGPGSLTRSLLNEGAKKLIVIEKDRRTLPALKEIQQSFPNRLEIILGDALEIDFSNIIKEKTKIVANLPYNIATPLLIGWLSNEEILPKIASFTLMFQKEVAKRICAIPNTKSYGRLAILCSYLSEAKILFDVDRAAFTPPPKVTSAIIQLVPKQINNKIKINVLERITQAAFGQRRKMLRQSLKTLGVNTDELLSLANIDGAKRAENLSLDDFIKLATILLTKDNF